MYLHKMYKKLNNLQFHFLEHLSRIERFRDEMLLSIHNVRIRNYV